MFIGHHDVQRDNINGRTKLNWNELLLSGNQNWQLGSSKQINLVFLQPIKHKVICLKNFRGLF